MGRFITNIVLGWKAPSRGICAAWIKVTDYRSIDLSMFPEAKPDSSKDEVTAKPAIFARYQDRLIGPLTTGACHENPIAMT